MSIIPVTNRRGRTGNAAGPLSTDLWDWDSHLMSLRDGLFSSLGRLGDSFPFSFSPSPFSPVNSRIDWRETPDSHVFRAYFPGLGIDDVLVEVGSDRVLKIVGRGVSSSYVLPDDSMPDFATADMEGGFLVVTVPKAMSDDEWGRGLGRGGNNVRVVEITGEDED
ncbi:hypothetical protein MLD38_017384 [Melastoma candidum]|uniref:Uncharacterized protein n=1 Tax=Melastoma candidum TaxID=119954 RepID=A0ACB9QSC4_9MYRT|nr:hypothetical protein MLD38_017384 [Melastoma candidum]